ncbi:MAG: hypothetical protein JWO71_4750 [Candidatus Acidoferrum typicum]|nr:hypothetical protein [Candidatus Acidoferrum typicum]
MDRLPHAMLEHRIQQRAYEIHQAKVTGSPVEDWLEAERQVLREISYCHDGYAYEAAQEQRQPH